MRLDKFFVETLAQIYFAFLSLYNVRGVYIEQVKLETNKSITIIGRKLFTIYENKPYATFSDIPYAKVPVQERRFKPPEGPKKLMPLVTYDFSNELLHTCDYGSSENCLNLVVYMPLSINERTSFPVVVWIYENFKDHEPDFLIEEDILVVAVSFRMSILGFLNTEDEFSKGNMGAKDVVMALRWIRNNIDLFKGNFNKVTVIGSGVGADIVASFLVSNAAEDLFNRVVIQSGSAISPKVYRKYNFKIINKLYWKLNGHFEKLNREMLYEFLSTASVNNLVLLSRNLVDSTEIRDNQRPINAFGCTIETTKRDSFMFKHPIEIYKRKLANYNVDVMFGFSNFESLFKLKDFINNRNLLRYLNHNFQYLLPFHGRSDEFNSKRYKRIQRNIMNFYFINGTISERSLKRYVKYHSDQVIYPLLQQARLHSEGSSGNVYLYRFSYNGSFNVKWKYLITKLSWSGATSGDEICYQFKCKSFKDMYNSKHTLKEKLFIKKLMKLLVNFVKYGNPTPKNTDNVLGSLKWELFNETLKVLNFGRTIKMITLPEEKRMRFWDKLKCDFFDNDL
ncbi:unnamed protein product [Parnassius mnemosyne]|uniref:Carboxylesterase type B domain-containing protein n=1 Tax=Parnassius mnemosyne TaxID=213953 RepID=A0AAV1KMX6_9NEOP